MELIALVLVLLGSFWAGTNASMTGLRFSNEVLEKVVVGKSGDQRLGIEFRQRLLRSSWLPARIMNTVTSLVVALVVMMIPSLLGQTNSLLATLCYIGATVPFLAAVAWTLFGVLEYRYAMEVINGDRIEKEQGSVEPHAEADG